MPRWWPIVAAVPPALLGLIGFGKVVLDHGNFALLGPCGALMTGPLAIGALMTVRMRYKDSTREFSFDMSRGERVHRR